MSDQPRQQTPDDGAASPAVGAGTPAPVDLAADRATRPIWLVFVGGPTVWFVHFMIVYLVTEAGCTGSGPGLEAFAPPVPVVTTLVATVPAVGACAALAVWAYRVWRSSSRELQAAPDDVADLAGEFDDDRRRGVLSFIGLLLSLFSVLAILFTAAPALVLGPC